MRALLQRVAAGAVTVEGEVARPIGRGLVVLLGVAGTDTDRDAAWLAEKILSLRIFPAMAPAAGSALPEGSSRKDRTGVSEFDLSVRDVGGDLLVVSQFTLHADVRKGRRPDFAAAAPPAQARALYDRFVTLLKAVHPRVVTGEFGAMMRVDIANDGPVTLLLDSSQKPKPAA